VNSQEDTRGIGENINFWIMILILKVQNGNLKKTSKILSYNETFTPKIVQGRKTINN
jgi:hypothetical protein